MIETFTFLGDKVKEEKLISKEGMYSSFEFTRVITHAGFWFVFSRNVHSSKGFRVEVQKCLCGNTLIWSHAIK